MNDLTRPKSGDVREDGRVWFDSRWRTPEQVERRRARKRITNHLYHVRHVEKIRNRKRSHYRAHSKVLNKVAYANRKSGKWKMRGYVPEIDRVYALSYYYKNRDRILVLKKARLARNKVKFHV